MGKCSKCSEEVQDGTRICRFCGHQLSPGATAASDPLVEAESTALPLELVVSKPAAEPHPTRRGRILYAILGIGILAFILMYAFGTAPRRFVVGINSDTSRLFAAAPGAIDAQQAEWLGGTG